MNRLKTSGFKGLSPLTPALLDLRTGILPSDFNGLLKSSKSSWILALELRLKQKVQHFCGVQDHSLSPAVLLPLTGVSGSDQRLRLVTPSLCHRHHQSSQPKKPGGDASRQERHRHPHHTATNGDATWIDQV
jgi:hypothetical protein